VVGYVVESSSFHFFSRDTASPAISTLSLHDALPISLVPRLREGRRRERSQDRLRQRLQERDARGVEADREGPVVLRLAAQVAREDRKSTRLNSSHVKISYAVFCLKKKKRCTK